MPAKTTLYSKAARLQREIAERVVTRDDFARLDSICAVDVAYDDTTAYCAAVVISRAGKLLEVAESASSIEYPYVPGFLMMRESPPVIRTLGMLKCNYDVLIVDGHGQLHPRRCGIACYLGVTLDIPAIGVAKSLLCGTVRSDGSIELDGRVTGREIVIGKKKLYVSVGHRISLETATSLVREVDAVREALRVADARSKKQKKEKRASS